MTVYAPTKLVSVVYRYRPPQRPVEPDLEDGAGDPARSRPRESLEEARGPIEWLFKTQMNSTHNPGRMSPARCANDRDA
jgi:hypothetical protein